MGKRSGRESSRYLCVLFARHKNSGFAWWRSANKGGVGGKQAVSPAPSVAPPCTIRDYGGAVGYPQNCRRLKYECDRESEAILLVCVERRFLPVSGRTSMGMRSCHHTTLRLSLTVAPPPCLASCHLGKGAAVMAQRQAEGVTCQKSRTSETRRGGLGCGTLTLCKDDEVEARLL